jgi:hypothetical protein
LNMNPPRERAGTAPGAAIDDDRQRLEARADAVRARLKRDLAGLREKARLLTSPREEAILHPLATLALGSSAAIALVAGVSVLAYRVSTRRERARQKRIASWMRFLERPDRVKAVQPSLWRGLVEKGASAAISAAVATLAKHYLDHLADRKRHPRPVGLLPAPDPFPTARRA